MSGTALSTLDPHKALLEEWMDGEMDRRGWRDERWMHMCMDGGDLGWRDERWIRGGMDGGDGVMERRMDEWVDGWRGWRDERWMGGWMEGWMRDG